MALAMIMAALIVVWGIYIATSQSIRLTIDPYPVPLSQRTANGVAMLFIVFGAALFLMCGYAMFFVTR